MRDRVEVQSSTATADALGQEIESWATTNTIWAEIRTLSGREAANAEQLKAGSTHMIRTRYFSGLTPALRLRAGSRVFQILSIDDTSNRHRELLITCQEQVLPSPEADS